MFLQGFLSTVYPTAIHGLAVHAVNEAMNERACSGKIAKKECPNKVGMTRQNFYGLPFLHLANHTHTSLVPSPSHPSFYLEIKAGVGRTANEATHTTIPSMHATSYSFLCVSFMFICKCVRLIMSVQSYRVV